MKRLVAACAMIAASATLAPPVLAQEPVPPRAPRAPSAPSAPSGVADDAKTRAKAHFDEGRAQYELGHFAEALASFERAYEALPLPALLFNIGQCHFQEKRYARAVFFYERYLELLPQAPNRGMVEGLIAESKHLDAEASSNASATAGAAANGSPSSSASNEDGSVMWIAAGVGAAVAITAGIVTWAMWTAPPPAGSLGLIDRRTP